MIGPEDWLLLGATAFVASTLSGVTGFGGAVILLPVATMVFGVREAVPVVTVAQLLGNLGRVWANWREVDCRLASRYALGAVPCALLGGYLFAAAPAAALTRLLGVFLLATAAVWYLRKDHFPRLPRWGFAPLGGATAFLSALVGSSGPVTAPFFVSLGLVKGAYIGTEALAAAVTHLAKLAAYGGVGSLTAGNWEGGCALGFVMVLGAAAGKRVVDRLPEYVFVRLVQVVLVAAGLLFLARGA